MRHVRRVVACLLLLAVAGMPAPAAERPERFSVDWNDPHLVTRGELAIVESEAPPGDAAPWQAVTLPDLWRSPERVAQGREGWYRFNLPRPPPNEPQAVYLWRFSMNAAVWFNGEKLGDGGSFAEPLARNWNRPLLFTVPTAAWRVQGNELLVRLRVYPGYGNLLPIAVGPLRLLAPDHERRFFAQITASQAAATVMALAMVAGLVLWSLDRRDTTYLHFAGLCGSLLVFALFKFARELPLPPRATWWLVHTATDAAYFFLFAFLHRALGLRRPKVERGLIAGVALCAALYALWSMPQLARYNALPHGAMLVAGLALIGQFAWGVWRRPTAESAMLVVVSFLLLACGVYDQLLNSLLVPGLWRSGHYSLALAMPVLLLGLLLQLALRSVRASAALRIANETLEARVRAASTEIEATYERERQLLAERSASYERERIYRDLHDNLGARLLGLVYSAGDERQRTEARAALTEMRTLVAASHVEAATLVEAMQEWRLEAELRCEAASQTLVWAQAGDVWLSARQRYQIECIARELVSNAIEHAGGSRIALDWRVDAGRIVLSVSDDGCGIAEGLAPASVRARTLDLGGSVAWLRADGGGTRALVSVPVGAAGATGATGTVLRGEAPA